MKMQQDRQKKPSVKTLQSPFPPHSIGIAYWTPRTASTLEMNTLNILYPSSGNRIHTLSRIQTRLCITTGFPFSYLLNQHLKINLLLHCYLKYISRKRARSQWTLFFKTRSFEFHGSYFANWNRNSLKATLTLKLFYFYALLWICNTLFFCKIL